LTVLVGNLQSFEPGFWLKSVVTEKESSFKLIKREEKRGK
jgi:hypothetical protein